MTQPKTDSGTTTSAWMATAQVPTFPPLAADAECDVCIVGGGMAGLSVAYTLARAGRHVIVLDDGPIGGGETGRTTAHLTWAMDDYYVEIEKVHGRDGARPDRRADRVERDFLRRRARGEQRVHDRRELAPQRHRITPRRRSPRATACGSRRRPRRRRHAR